MTRLKPQTVDLFVLALFALAGVAAAQFLAGIFREHDAVQIGPEPVREGRSE